MQKERHTTPATKNLNSRSFFQSSHPHPNSRTPTKNSLAHDVEKFSFTIESKKKQSIIDKIENLLPYFDILINKTEMRSVRMVERFMELKELIDEIFEDINDEFENASLENQELREALRRRVQMGNASHPELERRIENLIEELRLNKRSKEEIARRLEDAEGEKREAYGLLEEMKREVERIRREPSDRENLELRSLREELDGFRRKGVEESQNKNRRRPQDIYEDERAYESAKRRRDNDNQTLENKLRDIRNLEHQNRDLHSRLQEFKRVSDLGEQQIRRLKSDFQNERRQSVLNEEGLLRKLKALDDEKTRLLRQVEAQEGKSREQEVILRNVENQYQKERRNSIENARDQAARIRDLEKQNADIHSQGGYRVKELEDGIREKERKLQEYINELTKKSHLDQGEIRMLGEELENERRRTMADQGKIRNLESAILQQKQKAKGQIVRLQQALDDERRKSLADESKIKNLERILNEKVHLINENEGRNVLARDELAFLKNQIEKERRNSVADQQKIRKLENLLSEKEKYMNEINTRHSIAEKDIEKLQRLIEEERRKSTIDEARIRKLQGLLDEKVREANATHNKFLDLMRKSDMGDAQIKALQDELENQRRKSNADGQRIKKIEYLLKERERQIADEKNKRGEYERQIGFLQNEIEKERRNSTADQQKIRKLQQLQKEKEKLLEEYNKKHQDQMRVTDVNAEEIKFLKAELENQRRKSTADENTIRNLQKVIKQKERLADEHKNRHLNELKFLKEQIENERKKSFADEGKIRKLEEILAEKVRESEEHRRYVGELMRKSDLNVEELRALGQVLEEERRKSVLDQNLIKKLESVIKDQVGQIKERDGYLEKNNKNIEELRAVLENERKKSLADEGTIKKLEHLLREKTEEAGMSHKKYLQTFRKSQINEQQLKSLKEEMEKQRRSSALEIQTYNRKVRDLEGVKQNLSGKIDEDKRRLAETGNYVRQLEEKSANIERLYNDAVRQNASATQELNLHKGEIEKERRRSAALESKFVPRIQALVEENKGLIEGLKDLKRRHEESEGRIVELVGEVEKSRRRVGELEGVERQHREAIAGLERVIKDRDGEARRVIEQGVGELRGVEGELQRTRAEKERLRAEIASSLKETAAYRDSLQKIEGQLRMKAQALAEQVSNNDHLGGLLNELRRKEQELLARNEELVRQNAENSLVYESHLQGYLKGVKGAQSVVGTGWESAKGNVVGGFGEEREREKSHVVRVLKHESDVYRLETMIQRELKGDGSETSLDERY